MKLVKPSLQAVGTIGQQPHSFRFAAHPELPSAFCRCSGNLFVTDSPERRGSESVG